MAATTFSRNGLRFDVTESGPASGTPVILLHGFPERAASWDGVASGLNQAGYRTLAPDQRGYSPGARPERVGDYRIGELVGDVMALADDAGLERFHLVGHDWGGAVAWYAAAWHPHRLISVTSLSTPHPAAFAWSLVHSRQALRSYYMLGFQLRGLSERALLARGGSLLRRTLVGTGLDPDRADVYVAALRQPGALRGALNWYRALPLDLGHAARCGPSTVPTLYVWSTADTALGRAGAERTARHVEGPYRFEVLEGVSHWIPEADPEGTSDLLLQHFGAST